MRLDVLRALAVGWAFAVLPADVCAQRTVERPAPQFLVFAGMTRANASENFIGRGLYGGVAGLGVRWPARGWLALQPELHYAQRGTREPDTDLGEARIRTDYVDLPVLLRATLAQGGRLRPHLVLGPQIGLNVRCAFRVGGFDVGCDRFGGARRLDYGAVAGAGLDLSVAGRPLMIGVRYQVGLRDFPEMSESQHRVAQFITGLWF